VFNGVAKGRYVVTRVDYRLTLGGEPGLRYADLQRAFAGVGAPTLVEVAAKVREIRRGKGMLLVEGDADCRSAGSFFRNPVVPVERFRALTAELGEEPPHYAAGEGMVKLPAAWLMERAGFRKGYALGRVGISSKHTLALVNLGGATATEVLLLRERIVTAVEEQFGIRLEMEPVVVGDGANSS
jgi:UDP-N-acetylmuramate dehydrogenase